MVTFPFLGWKSSYVHTTATAVCTSKSHSSGIILLLLLLVLLTGEIAATTADDGTANSNTNGDDNHIERDTTVTVDDTVVGVVADINHKQSSNDKVNDDDKVVVGSQNQNSSSNFDNHNTDIVDADDNSNNEKASGRNDGSKKVSTTAAIDADNRRSSGSDVQGNKNDEDQPITGKVKGTNTWEAYRALLETQRKAQLEAIKQLLGIMHNEKQHDMLNVISKKVVEVLSESKATLVTAGFSPSDPFPEDEDLRDGLSKLIQNSLLYADLALRFPTFIHRMFDRNAVTRKLVVWCFEFVSKTGVTNGTSAEETIHLASQELNIVEREDNFINPYVDEQEVKLSKLVEEELKKSKKKMKKKKGPRISTRRTEL